MDIGESSYRRYLDGDDSRIVEIIKEYKDGLMLYINGFVRNIFIAEELTEEAFFKIATKRPRFAGKSSFKTWLYAIARNVTLDYLRHNSKIAKETVDEYGIFSAAQLNVEKEYLVKEQKIMLHRIMQGLKSEYVQILYLIYFENFSNTEAAVIMKKNKRQIENLIYRAKNTLKAELEKEGFEYEDL